MSSWKVTTQVVQKQGSDDHTTWPPKRRADVSSACATSKSVALSLLIAVMLLLATSGATVFASSRSSLAAGTEGVTVGLRVIKAPPGVVQPLGTDPQNGTCGHAELRAYPGASGSRGIAINLIMNSSRGGLYGGHWTLIVRNSGTDSGGIGFQFSPNWRHGYTHYAPRSGVVYGVILSELTITTFLGYTCQLVRPLATFSMSG